MFMKNSREVRGENAESYVAVIASAAKQSMRQQESKSGLLRFSQMTDYFSWSYALTLPTGRANMSDHAGVDHHHKAAEHHEHAAKHHREAAKHHEAGDHDKAAHHAHSAHGHASHAEHHHVEASRHHAEHHGQH